MIGEPFSEIEWGRAPNIIFKETSELLFKCRIIDYLNVLLPLFLNIWIKHLRNERTSKFSVIALVIDFDHGV